MSERATSRSIRRGMKRVGAPFYEEWEQAALVVLEGEGFPLKKFAVGALAGTGWRSIKRKVRLTEVRREFPEIAWMRSPTDEMGRGQLFEVLHLLLGERLNAVLLGVGRNDFEIAPLAEGKQRVACAASGMNAAKRGADTGVLCDRVDGTIEVAATEQNVIEQ